MTLDELVVRVRVAVDGADGELEAALSDLRRFAQEAAAAAGIACVAYDVVETDNWKQTFDVCRYKVKRMEDIERIVLNGNGRYAAI